MTDGEMAPAASQVFDRVRSIVGRSVGREPSTIPVNAGLKNGDWSSLVHVKILIQLGKEFGFVVTARLVRDLTSIPDIVEFVRSDPSSKKDLN
ncbi:MAG TPA: acyl carrier protein [Pseudonocardiaceae bacterium]